jgi:hypothetical protein
MTQPSTPPSLTLPDDTVAAIQAALGTEHAAIWVYGLVSAFLPGSFDGPITEGTTVHRSRRDAIARLLGRTGIDPEPAKPAYLTPQPVTDQASALALLVTAEQDATVAWRAALERSDDIDVRKTALEGLTGAAVQATKWRKLGGVLPLTPAQPGLS